MSKRSVNNSVYFSSKSNIVSSNEKKKWREGTKINWKFKDEASLSNLERNMRKIRLGGH